MSPQRPEGSAAGYPAYLIPLESTQQAESWGVAAAVRGSAELRRGETCPGVLRPAATPANAPRAELVDAPDLLASLVWHRVRPRRRATSEARPRVDASKPSKPNPGLVGAPDVAPPCPPISTSSVTTARAGLLVCFPRPIETLLSQLAWRRLPSFAPREGF